MHDEYDVTFWNEGDIVDLDYGALKVKGEVTYVACEETNVEQHDKNLIVLDMHTILHLKPVQE